MNCMKTLAKAVSAKTEYKKAEAVVWSKGTYLSVHMHTSFYVTLSPRKNAGKFGYCEEYCRRHQGRAEVTLSEGLNLAFGEFDGQAVFEEYVSRMTDNIHFLAACGLRTEAEQKAYLELFTADELQKLIETIEVKDHHVRVSERELALYWICLERQEVMAAAEEDFFDVDNYFGNCSDWM